MNNIYDILCESTIIKTSHREINGNEINFEEFLTVPYKYVDDLNNIINLEGLKESNIEDIINTEINLAESEEEFQYLNSLLKLCKESKTYRTVDIKNVSNDFYKSIEEAYKSMELYFIKIK